MKKLVADTSKCTSCGACEKVCSNAFYKTEDKEKSAIRITANETAGFSIAVCDQCGVCKEMCQPMALKTTAGGVVQLNKKICVGCLICVAECLRGFMYYHDELPSPFKCNACGLCTKQCPGGALHIAEN